ncbi:MAG: hypothetical protein ACRDQD_00615 [Nocardioidaceae bacterium]
MNTIEFAGFDLPLEALLWLGLAVLLAACVLALVTGLHFGGRPRYKRSIARAVVNEVMGTDTGAHVPPEPPRGARIVTPEGHWWTRTVEGMWESEEAPHVVASWQVLAGLGVHVATHAGRAS